MAGCGVRRGSSAANPTTQSGVAAQITEKEGVDLPSSGDSGVRTSSRLRCHPAIMTSITS